MSHKNDQRQTHWHVRVKPRTPQLDGHARSVLADIRQTGFAHIEGVSTSKIYFFSGTLDESDMNRVARQLLTDPVAETFTCGPGFSHRDDCESSIEVHRQPGVMNPAAISTQEAAQRLLQAQQSSATIDAVQTARRYNIIGAMDANELDQIASRVLANDCIESWYIQGFDRQDTIRDDFPTPPKIAFSLQHVSIRELNDEALTKLSREGHLFLSLEEMQTIRDYYKKLQREPTDLELETLAQTWSEHCVHKTLKSAIEYKGEDFGQSGNIEARFDNLLKETIAGATTKLNRDWCLSVFVDNAGVIAFDDDWGIAFKAETHNHPSAIEPYGGAATGIGGCIRDIMGCGLGAKPIASTDVFCLAPPDFDHARLPGDVLHPRRVLKGVVGGIRDYGNRMGIPTVNGAIYFDDRYLANPLVFCGCIGLIPRDRIHKQPNVGDRIVVAGGRTGRDGIHGATFSSAELTDTHADEFSHAVQIGNAVEEKKVLDAQLIARDHPDGCLYSAVTDCGAGGLSSAVGEMGEQLGATVDLENVPLKYAGLRYDEIWISEAQERMVYAVPPDKLDTLLKIFAAEDVEATVIGTFTGDQRLTVRYDNQTVGELDMSFLHEGNPQTRRKATWTSKPSTTNPEPHASEPRAPEPHASACADSRNTTSTNQKLLNELSQYNTASKEWVIRQYDHEVQGRSVVKPLVGPASGPSDAAVIKPLYNSSRGIAIGCGLCPELTEIDPYIMAIAAIDEALRNIICVGADPQRTAILDNFCWPKVDTEESLGSLVRTCCGARDAAIAYGLPFVSGKDSLNNEFSMSEAESKRTGLPKQLAIPGTLLISALGIVKDVRKCVTMDFKTPGNVIVVASEPVVEPEKHRSASLEKSYALHCNVADLIQGGKVRAAHDVSDGGLAGAIAEMCIASMLGADVKISHDAYNHSLFTPIATTYVLEMSAEDAKFANLPIIGKINNEPRLMIQLDHGDGIDLSITELDKAWRSPLAMDEPRIM